MTIKTGPLKLGADVAPELGLPVTGKLTLGDSRVRQLAGKPSGPLKLSDLQGKSAYPPAGTLLSTFCSGFNKMGRYANGSGGSYDSLIQANSTECGYVPGAQFTLVAGKPAPGYDMGNTGYNRSWGYSGPDFGSLSPASYKGYTIGNLDTMPEFYGFPSLVQVGFPYAIQGLVNYVAINGTRYSVTSHTYNPGYSFYSCSGAPMFVVGKTYAVEIG